MVKRTVDRLVNNELIMAMELIIVVKILELLGLMVNSRGNNQQ